MSGANSHPIPTEISLHQKTHLLVVEFDNNQRFELPCEYLRVFSRAAEVRTMQDPVTGKEQVNIEKIEAQGNYAIRVFFDDGHSSGIYSWETLYDLGQNYESHWQDYLQRLQEFGYERNVERSADGQPVIITVLFFIHLVKELKTENEEIELPDSVNDVKSLLEMLRKRGEKWQRLLQDDSVQVTVNKEFSAPFTRLESGDEVAIVPLGGVSKSQGKVSH
jgi:DUF971 family protein/molybdopterin converting factor small subunit